MIKAAAFDLGNTLFESSLPLNWQDHYGEAMSQVLAAIGCPVNEKDIAAGKEILMKYNTRVHPREKEIHIDILFRELFEKWGVTDRTHFNLAKEVFASFFLNRLVVYPDTLPALQNLKQKGIRMGVLTNVAYGLGREYMNRNIVQIEPYIDVLLTSVETEFRKPNVTGYLKIAEALQANPGECLFIGDEEVDVLGANNSGMISVLLDRSGSSKNFGQNYTITSLAEIETVLEQNRSGADYLGKDGI